MEKYFEKYQFIRYSNDPTGTLLEDLMPLLRSQNVGFSSTIEIDWPKISWGFFCCCWINCLGKQRVVAPICMTTYVSALMKAGIWWPYQATTWMAFLADRWDVHIWAESPPITRGRIANNSTRVQHWAALRPVKTATPSKMVRVGRCCHF